MAAVISQMNHVRRKLFNILHKTRLIHCSASVFDVYQTLLEKPNIKRYLCMCLDNDQQLLQNNNLLYNLLTQKLELQKEISSLLSLENDVEMKDLVKDEKIRLEKGLNEIYRDILTVFQHLNDENGNEVVLEVNSAVGGKESMLFADELWEMYKKFVIWKRWNWEEEQYDRDDVGGLRRGVARISGQFAGRLLLHEAGVHRVQRTPATEKSGRIHTSTASVAVLSIPDTINIEINPADLRFETKTSSGAGGQHVNKTESCVRVTHVPSGIVIENQTDRSQIRNRKIAIERLRERLYQMEVKAVHHNTKVSKKTQVGDSERSDKIRTYNYPQDRITDHRIGVSLHNIQAFLEGGQPLDNLIQKLTDWRTERNIEQFIDARLTKLGC